MTNAEKIRQMSEGGLALVVSCPNETGLADIPCDMDDSCNCYECLLKWLRAEADAAREVTK